MTQTNVGDEGTYRDAAGIEHPGATCAHVWPGGESVNVVYTEGGARYADCNVPVITSREERSQPGRFFEKGAHDDE